MVTASIKTECKLFKIPLLVFSFNVVVYSEGRALAEIAPKLLNRVRICTTNCVDVMTMIHDYVFVYFLNSSPSTPVTHTENCLAVYIPEYRRS